MAEENLQSWKRAHRLIQQSHRPSNSVRPQPRRPCERSAPPRQNEIDCNDRSDRQGLLQIPRSLLHGPRLLLLDSRRVPAGHDRARIEQTERQRAQHGGELLQERRHG